MPVTSHLTDIRLAERCREGDLAAFEELYRAHGHRIYAVAYRMLGHAADAEDLTQEVFLTAHRKLSSYRGDASLGTWLYRLAVNLCLDRVRSRARREDQRTDHLEDERTPGDGNGRRLDVVERIDLERAIRALPEACRAAFLLHDIEGFEHREVATLLGIAEGTSKSQVHKARRRLRRALAPSHQEGAIS